MAVNSIDVDDDYETGYEADKAESIGRRSSAGNGSVSSAKKSSAITEKKYQEVCLKFMRNRDQFLTELAVRQSSSLNPLYVIAILCSYDGMSDQQVDKAFRESAKQKGFEKYPYAVVMEKADLSLKRIIDQHYIAGEDWDAIRTIFKQIVTCIQHLHSRQLIHGDIKPMNIMQV